MARERHHEEEHDKHERWLVSYADFITLLFAFFVVMYSISSVNEGKYRVLSDSLDTVFRAHERSSDAVSIGQPARAPISNPGNEHPGAQVGEPSPSTINELEEAGLDNKPQGAAGPRAAGAAGTPVRDAQALARQVQDALADLAAKKLIEVSQGGDWVEVEMKSNILFDSGSARLSDAAIPILTEVAAALNKFSNTMQVEGFTDNKPINTSMFPSNWELSAARAASVVHLFTKLEVDPVRMSAVGFGEFRPKSDNITPEGRQQNRRVVVRISTSPADRVQAPAAAVPAPPVAIPIQSAPAPESAPAAAPVFKSITDLPGREGPEQ